VTSLHGGQGGPSFTDSDGASGAASTLSQFVVGCGLDEKPFALAALQHFTKHLTMPSQPEPASALPRRLFGRPANYLVRAAKSAYYPLQGIWYFLRRPYFYPLFVGRLLPLSIISLLVYFILFTFAFLPQLAFLAIFHGWAGAWISAIVLVLGEGLVVIQGIFEGFFVDECRVDVFDVS
jgi:hypothetical protein